MKKLNYFKCRRQIKSHLKCLKMLHVNIELGYFNFHIIQYKESDKIVILNYWPSISANLFFMINLINFMKLFFSFSLFIS